MKNNKERSDVSPPAFDDARCPSGVEGLDEILSGGLPRDCIYLIQGDPGSGKTTLAMQFLLEGVRRGEKALYITLSETRQELLKVAGSHGWSLDDVPLLEISAIEMLLRPEAQTTVFHPSEVELAMVSQLLLDEVDKHKPARVVFDSLSEFRLMADSPLRYRRELLRLKQEFVKYHSTVLLLDDKMHGRGAEIDPHVYSLTHGVIEMEQLSPDFGMSRRRLRVQKLRGVKFREGYHDYTIDTGGLKVFPRLVAAEHHVEFQRVPVASGIKELDDLFGGGLDRGTTTLILGSAGTGKSTLALQYAAQMVSQGERGLIFAFDETRGLLMARAKALGMDLDQYIRNGCLTIQQVDPAELSPGEFVVRIVRAVEAGCKLVVIDSLNGYLHAMPGERYLVNQLHELSSYLNQQGVLTIVILAQHGLTSVQDTPVDLTYLADTVVASRFFESAGHVKQALAIIKKRSGQHEKTIREFKIEAGRGLRVGPPIREFRGVLTGMPVYEGPADKIMQADYDKK